LTDQGKNYTAQLIKEICEICSTRKLQTTAYHPQTDGLVERFNHTLTNMLSNYVNTLHTDWDVFLPYVTFAYNTTKQASANYSPFFLLYGREARLPIDVTLQTGRPTYFYDSDEYAMQLREMLSRAYQTAGTNIQRAQDKQKRNYDRTALDLQFNVGDKVFKRVGQIAPGTSPKFTNKYEGPYTIDHVSTPNVTMINSLGKKEVVHVNRLKPYAVSRQEPGPLSVDDQYSMTGGVTTMNQIGTNQQLTDSKSKAPPLGTHKHFYNLRPRK